MESLMIYIVMFSIISIIIILHEKQTNKKSKIYLIIAFSILLIFSGFRYYVGTDYMNYVNMYDVTSKTTILKSNIFESGFLIIINISKYILNNYIYMFFISSFVTLIFIFKMLYEEKNKISITLFLLMYCCIILPMSFNLIRQGISIAIIIYANKYLVDEKYSKYIFFIFLASLFHITSLIMIPIMLWIILNRKNSKLSYIIFISIGIYLFYNNSQVINYLTSSSLFSHFTMYEIEENFNLIIALNAILLRIPLIIIAYFNKKMVIKENKNYEVLYKLMWFEVLFIATKGITFFAQRLSLYFSFAPFVLMSIIVFNIKDKNNKIIYTCILIIYCVIYFIWSYYILNQANIFPYQNILFLK